MIRYVIEYEDENGRFKRAEGDYEYLDECYEQAGKLFDNGVEDDFRIVELENGKPCGTIRLPAYKLVKNECPICGKEVRAYEMLRTYDCHGIPYRLVCPDCYEEKMYGTPGYDGEYYNEYDECY